MNIALLGNGKTGSHVRTLAADMPGVRVTVFDRSHPPLRQSLAGHDAVISFLPGPAFLSFLPELMACRLPVVSGSTGFDWPGGREEFSRKISETGLHWVHASNFSIGMSLIHEMIQTLSLAGTLYDEYAFSIHEVHHKNKKDAPSGTALAWRDWLGAEAETTSERTGDVIGEHELTLTTPYEQIRLRHVAGDRKLFASGALWTVRQVLHGDLLPGPGLYDLQQLVFRHLKRYGRLHTGRAN
jgi:4-hydroxy-tetrahydrodipicolinate reductase